MKGKNSSLVIGDLSLVSSKGQSTKDRGLTNLVSLSSLSSLFTFYFLLFHSSTTRANQLPPVDQSVEAGLSGEATNIDDLSHARSHSYLEKHGVRATTDAVVEKGQDVTDKLALEIREGLFVKKALSPDSTSVLATDRLPHLSNKLSATSFSAATIPLLDSAGEQPKPMAKVAGSKTNQEEVKIEKQHNFPVQSSLFALRSKLTSEQVSKFKPANLYSQSPVSQSQPSTNPSQNPSTPADLSPTEVRIITPQNGVIGARKTNLVVQYRAGTQVQVTLNKKPLDTKQVQTQIEPVGGNAVTQVWYNIPLEKGENTLTVQAGNGTPVSIKLAVKDTSNTIYKIEIAPASQATAPADGRSTINLEGSIADENGNLIVEDTVVTLTSSAGKFVGTDYDKDQPGFQVLARAGKFTALLQSGLEAQKVKIRAAVERRLVKDPSRRVLREDSQSTPAAVALPPTSSPSNPQSSDSPKNIGIPPNSNNPLPTPASGNPENPLTPDIEAYTQVEFVTFLRPPLTTGVINLRIGGRSTDFFGPRANFLNPDRSGTSFDLSGAVFSTGKVGDWLFTGAYNSQRALNQTCDYSTRLFRGPQFCEQTYPVYGDSSTVDYLTPSRDSVYARFERTSRTPGAEPDYLMWGDYNTREFARASQLFSATTRNLHGFKANYSFGNLQITGMYSNDVEGFERDTIAPNGTSGYYFLSRRLLVPGSENVYLESEEINRPGTVLERKPLYRGPDYEIDYDRGTLLFRRPMLATELNPFGASLVRRIVVTYQYDNAGGGNTRLYAGRAQYNFSQGLNQRNSWIAGSYLREDQGRQDFELYGADLLFPLGKDGQIVGEFAHSRNNSIFLGTGDVTGNAYRVEAYARVTPWLQARSYYRNVETGFANNATTSFSPGQTRYGAQIAANLTRTTQLTASYDRERNYGIAPATRTEFFDLFNPRPIPTPGSRVNNIFEELRAGVVQKIGAADLSLEYVHRSRIDNAGTGLGGNADQVVSRASVPLTSTLAFRAQNEYNFNRNDPLYPSRTTFGFDWALFPGINLRLAHQFLDTRVFGRGSITSLDTIMDRRLGENTSITWRYSLLNAYNSITGEGAVGLNHRIVLAPGLRMNVAYEHIFSNQFRRTGAGQEFPQPYAVGQSASSLGLSGGDAYSVGLEYTDNPKFQASGRLEYRTGGVTAENWVISAGAAGKISPALTALVRYDQANAANQLLQGLGNTSNLKLGLAYRDPASDKFNGLLRYEYRRNPSTIPETLLLGSGTGSVDHLLALEGIYAPSWRWEFYGKYAMRYSRSFLASDFTNSSTVYLGQVRAAYRLGYRMDVAGEVRTIGQSAVNYNELGFAIETGYYLTPDLRLYLGYSFGRVDDRDFTGYRSKGGPYIGVALKLNELFAGFGRQKVAPPQQQESQVKPVAANPDRSQSEVQEQFGIQSSEFEFQTPPPRVQLSQAGVEISHYGIQIPEYGVQPSPIAPLLPTQ